MRPSVQLGYASYEALRKDLVKKRIAVLIRKGRYDTLVESLDTFKPMIAIAAIFRALLPMMISAGYCVWSKHISYWPISFLMLLVLVVPTLPAFVYVFAFTIGLITIMMNGPIVLSMILIGCIAIPLGNVILQSVINYSAFRMLIRDESSFDQVWSTNMIYLVIDGKPRCSGDM